MVTGIKNSIQAMPEGGTLNVRVTEFPGKNVQIVVEPSAKNTAPAIALAAELLPVDAIMLICPSDHHIADAAAFRAAAVAAAGLAADDWMVAFGIAPDRPETGFGYIETGAPLDAKGAAKVQRFVEKPDLQTATHYLESGNFLWNSGMFCFAISTLLAELKIHAPELLEQVAKLIEGRDVAWHTFQYGVEPAECVPVAGDHPAGPGTEKGHGQHHHGEAGKGHFIGKPEIGCHGPTEHRRHFIGRAPAKDLRDRKRCNEEGAGHVHGQTRERIQRGGVFLLGRL